MKTCQAQAIIASNGRLTPSFEYIDELRKSNRSRQKTGTGTVGLHSKRALVLGAGYVSSPLVEYLTREGSNMNVTVGKFRKTFESLNRELIINVSIHSFSVKGRSRRFSSQVSSRTSPAGRNRKDRLAVRSYKEVRHCNFPLAVWSSSTGLQIKC